MEPLFALSPSRLRAVTREARHRRPLPLRFELAAGQRHSQQSPTSDSPSPSDVLSGWESESARPRLRPQSAPPTRRSPVLFSPPARRHRRPASALPKKVGRRRLPVEIAGSPFGELVESPTLRRQEIRSRRRAAQQQQRRRVAADRAKRKREEERYRYLLKERAPRTSAAKSPLPTRVGHFNMKCQDAALAVSQRGLPPRPLSASLRIRLSGKK